MSTVQIKTKYRWRLLHGNHHERDPITGKIISYKAGNGKRPIIATNQNLGRLNQKDSRKFELVSDDPNETVEDSPQDVIPSEDILDAMTDDELRKLAEEEEIDLGKLKNREQILKKIREGMSL